MNIPFNDKNQINPIADKLDFLNTVLTKLPGMVYYCLYDEHWTMTFVSEGCKTLSGYNDVDLIYNNLISYEKVIVEEHRKMVRDIIDEAIKKGTMFDVEYRIKNKAGHTLWVHERGTPIYDESGNAEALEGYVQDITE